MCVGWKHRFDSKEIKWEWNIKKIKASIIKAKSKTRKDITQKQDYRGEIKAVVWKFDGNHSALVSLLYCFQVQSL